MLSTRLDLWILTWHRNGIKPGYCGLDSIYNAGTETDLPQVAFRRLALQYVTQKEISFITGARYEIKRNQTMALSKYVWSICSESTHSCRQRGGDSNPNSPRCKVGAPTNRLPWPVTLLLVRFCLTTPCHHKDYWRRPPLISRPGAGTIQEWATVVPF